MPERDSLTNYVESITLSKHISMGSRALNFPNLPEGKNIDIYD